jgi:membrane fusion protein, multidrug efflux system
MMTRSLCFACSRSKLTHARRLITSRPRSARFGAPRSFVALAGTLAIVRNGMLILFATFGLIPASGCRPAPAQVAAAGPPALPVSKPVRREITNFVEFTGRTDAVQAVDIRPRVTGYLVQMPFKEGSEVKKGELLYEIDPRPYEAQLDQAVGQVDLYKAQWRLAQVTYQRDRAIAQKVAGSVSQQQLDQDMAVVDEAAARIKAYEAYTKVYKLNLEFTKVSSPIDGQISRYYLTVGNLVNQDQTLLTTVVSLDPMYVYFDMDEPTLLRIRKATSTGVIDVAADGSFPVLMGLQGEEGFPRKGTVNFVNNQVNPATGSITMRGIFANPKTGGGARVLSPGMFVRVRLPIGRPHEALLVIDRAVSSDQGLKFVYVADADHKVEYRRVTTGALQEDGLREITEGLKADDWVLVGGLQQARAHSKIQPEERPMPTMSAPAPALPDAQTKEGKSPAGAKP